MRPREQFPGRRVLTGCFIVLGVTSGLAFYGLAVYLNAFSREKDWPVASISLATTLFFVVSGVAGLAIARIIARRDVRIVIVAGGVLGAVALTLLGRVDSRWQLYVVYSVLAAGFAAAGLVPATTVVTRWYHRRRSVALSIASTGLSVGGIAITPVAKWLIDHRGLEDATPILGAVWLVGVIPTALWLIRPDPGLLGWAPDGDRVTDRALIPAASGVRFGDAVRSRFYLGITAGYVLVLGAQVGAIQQLVKLVEDRTDADTAALATIALAGMSVVARLAGGRLVTRVPMAGFAAAIALTQGVSIVAIGLADHTVTLFAAIVLFGATVGNVLMLQPLLIAERFGVVDYPRIFSRSQFYTMFGVAGGPLLLGWLHDRADSYRTPYLVAGVCSVAGAAVLLWGGPATVRTS